MLRNSWPEEEAGHNKSFVDEDEMKEYLEKSLSQITGLDCG